MNALRYLPGDWFALIRPAHVVLLPGDTAATDVSSLWEQMDDAATVESLLTGILSAAQMKISSMPPFAIVSREDAPHVVVRGQVSFATANGSEQARGRDVATWLERRFGAADGWDVGVGAGDDGHWLPIAEGIVRVSGLRHGANPDGAEFPAQDATTAVHPTPPQDAIASDAESDADAGTATAARVALVSPVTGAKPGVIQAAAATKGEDSSDADADAEEAATEPRSAPADAADEATATEQNAEPATDGLDASEADTEEAAPDLKTEPAEPAEPADDATPTRQNAEPATERHDAAEADTEDTSGQLPAGTTNEETDRSGESVDLAQVSLASELLGRREDTADGQVLPGASTGSAEPLEDDVDNLDTILTPRAPKPATRAAGTEASAAPAPTATPAPTAAPAQAAAPAPGPGLIGSMPWMRKAATEPPPAPPKPSVTGVPQAEDLDGDDDGNTILRSDLPTANPVAAAAEDPDARPANGPANGPAEGSTTSSAEGPSGGSDEGLTLTGHHTTSAPREFVLARSCRNGHPNPPTAASCKKCGAVLSGEAHQEPRPPLGKMVIADGPDGRETVHELTRSVLLGRQPSAQGLPRDLNPQLVQVQSPSGDISRNHLQVRLEGWHVELVDMGATNGSVLLRAGNSPRRLARNEAVMLLDGDVADLGDGVSLRFEELP
ncbi:hypothetical protein GCM10009715_24480 [Paeniglutamicibacter psychrophenolicus]|uniref:FHA domain-containing protein n=1 Tax=Paeniglutamicibacter psychrophenolicus TaxID=257454 RepID=A0ABS4WIU2_9MICC|nr:FHA domain-containing protein [Paeniglutamicibacter psychrophenolicus]MBP2375878.1 hypothetical protein [Paeniglutamicibacter psychrophenolicus]